jgi:hypothetical protein
VTKNELQATSLATESEHESLLVALQAAGRPAVPPVTGMVIGAAAAHLEGGTDEDWSKVGIPIGRQALIDMLRALESLPACQPGAASPADEAGGKSEDKGMGLGPLDDDDVDLTRPDDSGAGLASASSTGTGAPPGEDGLSSGLASLLLQPAAATSTDAVPSVADILGMWSGSTAVNRLQLAEHLHSSLAKRRCLSSGDLPSLSGA